jgi:hypothetical protein
MNNEANMKGAAVVINTIMITTQELSEKLSREERLTMETPSTLRKKKID